MKKGIYEENGVKFSKQSVKIGDKVELIYNGLLKNSGATALKAHIGYNEGWEEPQTIEMELKDEAFTVSLTLAKTGTLNCAFVDPMGNWDNNSGDNYSFKVAKATAAKKVAAAKAPVAKSADAKKTTPKAKKAPDSKESVIKKVKNEAASAKKAGITKDASSTKKPAKEKKKMGF